MKIKSLFSVPDRFTTPDKAGIVLVYDAMNLFFTMALSQQIGAMCTSTHIPSGHIYGTFRRLVANIRMFTAPGQRVGLVFALDDEPKEAQAILPEYKLNRDAHQTLTEDDKNLRFDSFYELLRCLPCTFASSREQEADNVIATLAHKYDKSVVVMSSDKDLWPLMCRQNVQVVSMRKSAVITDMDIRNKFSLPRRKDTYKVALYKAVMGDSSDNIPKVPRMPSKEFHTVLNDISYTGTDDCVTMLLEKASELKNPRAHRLLLENETLIRRNLQLTTLKTNLNVDFQWHPGSKQNLENLFKRFECQSILDGNVHNFLFDNVSA